MSIDPALILSKEQELAFKALHGRNTLDIDNKEMEVLNFAFLRGRIFNISLAVFPSEETKVKLMKAKSSEEYNNILDRAGQYISINCATK